LQKKWQTPENFAILNHFRAPMRTTRSGSLPPIADSPRSHTGRPPLFSAESALLILEYGRERERKTRDEEIRATHLRRLMAVKSYLRASHANELAQLLPDLMICVLDGEIDSPIIENDDDDVPERCSMCLEVEAEFILCARCADPAPVCEGCLDKYVLGGSLSCHMCRGPMLQPAKNRE
jgi:hypothetical protein